MMFMGEKDHQQYFLVQDYISKKYPTFVYSCKTIRDSNGMALSSRNRLLNKADLKTSGLIANKLFQLKQSIKKINNHNYVSVNQSKKLIKKFEKKLINKFNIKIEYLECRNLINFTTNLNKKPFKLFISYYINNVRLIDNF